MRPVVIAHRGASGHLPEHTVQAKALAFAMGADYLEQDIVATRDDRLVVLHDIHLDRVTDVAERFPRRSRADGRYYVRDFDLDEILTLTVHERVDAGGQQVFPQRLAHSGAEFRVHTLERELALVATLRDNTGRDVGIYPEIKAPAWHVREGVDITALVLETLRSAGYAEHADPVYLQCFDAAEVRRIRHELGCALKLVQLIGEDHWDPEPTDFATMRTPAGLKELARTVDGIGPWVNQLYAAGEGDHPVRPGNLVSEAHELGLAVHPYTFRSDALPQGFGSFEEVLRFFTRDVPVDGLFTDFPGEVVAILRRILA
jgi:glycerophosphoryl diester phosphodiesterase